MKQNSLFFYFHFTCLNRVRKSPTNQNTLQPPREVSGSLFFPWLKFSWQYFSSVYFNIKTHQITHTYSFPTVTHCSRKRFITEKSKMKKQSLITFWKPCPLLFRTVTIAIIGENKCIFKHLYVQLLTTALFQQYWNDCALPDLGENKVTLPLSWSCFFNSRARSLLRYKP